MIHSFLLIGQSNMAGRGKLADATPIKTDNIRVLRNGRWQPMFRPVNFDRQFSGVSLAESFAEQYSEKYGVTVGLIPCADGGTSLLQWKPGSLLFDNAVYNATLAQRTSTIAGVLWHQGESDCADDKYPLYRERFEEIMNALRKQLNLYDVPFLVGGLGDFLKDRIPQNPNYVNAPKVNEILKTIAEENKMTGFVNAENLKGNSDNLHFCSEALYEFGHRYFEVFETLRDPNKVFLEKSHPDDALRTELESL